MTGSRHDHRDGIRRDLVVPYHDVHRECDQLVCQAMRADLGAWRDELIVSTKAGYLMWPGPYGEWGSRKYLLAGLDQSLRRMVGTPCLIHQMKYSMFVRTAEQGLLKRLAAEGVGGIAFSPLAQGLLTDRYARGIPDGSRASNPGTLLKRIDVTEARLVQVRALNEIARQRGQTLAQMALAWVLRHGVMSSALVGASRVEQIEQCVGTLNHRDFTADELRRIDEIAPASIA